MIIVSDTSPISNLLVIGRLALLKQVYGNIVVPPAVMNEVIALERFGYDLSALRNSPWINVAEPSDKEAEAKYREALDAGEAAAITLALELDAPLAIDEKKGRKIARALGIEVVGLVGILIEAKEIGILGLVRPVLDELRSKAGFRISDRFYREILETIGE